jgi:3',5'-cyclic-AMP phosphodiesterase
MSKTLIEEISEDGIDRRGFLKCMAWVGTGLVWTMSGGILAACNALTGVPVTGSSTTGDFSFVQVSDSHIGFKNDPNKDVTATFQTAIDKINTMPTAPEFLIHTGDLTHLSKADQFDTVSQVMKSSKASQMYYVPGEHDVIGDNGKSYLNRFGKGTSGSGWQSFDYKGVHFIGLVNVVNLQAGGLGTLGAEQLAWMKKDVQGLSKSTPVIVFAHIPLWAVYPAWGWATDDSTEALSYLKDFGSVTVLNGHIHQILQKVEGSVTFHTARSTAFPQPAPGTAPAPGPIKNVPADKLRSTLGITDVTFNAQKGSLAVVDSTLV